MTLAALSTLEDPPFALAPLLEVAASLQRARAGQLPTGGERNRLLAMVATAGSAVFPQLLRALGSSSESEAEWAGQLLRRTNLTEVTTRLHQLLTMPAGQDAVKARALAILADLGVSPPSDVSLRDPEQFIARSVAELLATIASADDLRRTTDDLLTAVPADELPAVLREVVRHGGEMGAALLEAVLLDGRTPDAIVAELIPLTRPTRKPVPRLRQIVQLPVPSSQQPRRVLPVGRTPSRRMLLDALPVRRKSATARPRPTHRAPAKQTQALSALSSARYDEAVTLLKEIVAEQPEHQPSWLNLAVAYSALAQHRQADRCLRRALHLVSTSRRHG